MTATALSTQRISRATMGRLLCAALALVVILDVIDVKAPGLGLLCIPFLIGAWRLRGATVWGTTLLLLFALLYVVVGVNFIAANGFDAGWGDLVFAYAGTPLAAALVACCGFLLADRRR